MFNKSWGNNVWLYLYPSYVNHDYISLLNVSNFITACTEDDKQRGYSLQEVFANSMLRKQ